MYLFMVSHVCSDDGINLLEKEELKRPSFSMVFMVAHRCSDDGLRMASTIGPTIRWTNGEINLLEVKELKGPSADSLEHSQYLGVAIPLSTQIFSTNFNFGHIS